MKFIRAWLKLATASGLLDDATGSSDCDNSILDPRGYVFRRAVATDATVIVKAHRDSVRGIASAFYGVEIIDVWAPLTHAATGRDTRHADR